MSLSACSICEKQLPLDKLLACAQCKAINYCKKEEQAEHWKNGHKKDCKRLVEAAKRGYLVVPSEDNAVDESNALVAESGDKVSMSYEGSLVNGKIFDKNDEGTFSFVLGEGHVIKGWDEGICGLRVGQEAILYISPSFGYGQRGFPGAIPPNSFLIFKVKCTGVSKPQQGLNK